MNGLCGRTVSACGRSVFIYFAVYRMSMDELDQKLDRLRVLVRSLGNAVVAFSGGVDSTLVLRIAQEELGERALAITAASASVPAYELGKAEEIARHIGARHLIIRGKEMNDANYRKNDSQRCYFCKSNLYTQLREVAAAQGFGHIINGINKDDLFDFRPGIRAAQELRVHAPLKEAGLGKMEVVELARHFGLPNWNKPASPCLASRVPYGIAVTPEILAKIEKAEDALREAGLRQFRVRYHNEIARIEVMPAEFARVIEQAPALVERIRAAGFRHVTLDLAGFKSGGLNVVGVAHAKGVSRSGLF